MIYGYVIDGDNHENKEYKTANIRRKNNFVSWVEMLIHGLFLSVLEMKETTDPLSTYRRQLPVQSHSKLIRFHHICLHCRGN